jgi:hypothetical protein
MRLLLERPVAEGAQLGLAWGRTTLSATVAYCCPLRGRFAVGVHLARPLLNRELAELVETGKKRNPDPAAANAGTNQAPGWFALD